MRVKFKIIYLTLIILNISLIYSLEREPDKLSPKSIFPESFDIDSITLDLIAKPEFGDIYLCRDQHGKKWYLKLNNDQSLIQNEYLGFQLARFFRINTPPFFLVQGDILKNITGSISINNTLSEFKEGASIGLLTKNITQLKKSEIITDNSGLEQLFVFYMLISNLDYSYYHNYIKTSLESEIKYFGFDFSLDTDNSFLANKVMDSVFLINYLPELNIKQLNKYIDWLISIDKKMFQTYLINNNFDENLAESLSAEYESKKGAFKRYFSELINNTLRDKFYYFDFYGYENKISADEVISGYLSESSLYYFLETKAPVKEIISELITDREKVDEFMKLVSADKEYLKNYYMKGNSFISNDLQILEEILTKLLKNAENSMLELEDAEELSDIYNESLAHFKEQKKLIEKYINILTKNISFLATLNSDESIIKKQLKLFSASL